MLDVLATCSSPPRRLRNRAAARIGALVVVAQLGCGPEPASDPGCDGDEPPCAREMCLACAKLGGYVLIEQKGGRVCSDRQTHTPLDVDEADFCREPYCVDVRSPLDATAVDPAASDMLDLVDGVHALTLTWFPHGMGRLQAVDPPAETTTELTFAVEPRGPVVHVRGELVVPETDGVPDHARDGYACPQSLELEATISISTDDGRWQETLEDVLVRTITSDDPYELDDLVRGPERSVALPAGVSLLAEDLVIEDVVIDLDVLPHVPIGILRATVSLPGIGRTTLVVAYW